MATFVAGMLAEVGFIRGAAVGVGVQAASKNSVRVANFLIDRHDEATGGQVTIDTMNQQEIIQKTADYVKQEFLADSSGHDWWHIYRVWRNAITICAHEKADSFIAQLAALLHDLDDWKFNAAGEETPLRAKAWLESFSLDPAITEAVCHIIERISFKGASVANPMDSLEGFIVQDADRLDAIGAIGIVRAFAYGGHKNRPLYDPETPPQMHDTFEQYKNSHSSTINHFYEKLLLLKDVMNTPTARRIAQQRHEYMEQFLSQFMNEWEGKDLV